MTNNLRLEVADAAGLLADADFEGFLRRRGFGAGFGEIVDEGDDLAFGCLRDRVVGALADGIVRRDLQLFDIGADQHRALVGGEIPVRQAEAIDIQIAIPEILVFLVVEGFQRRRLIGLERSDCAIEHRLPVRSRCQLRFREGRRARCQNQCRARGRQRSCFHVSDKLRLDPTAGRRIAW